MSGELLLQEIARYLSTQSTRLTRGPSTSTSLIPIWLGQIPDVAPSASVGLYESGGAPPLYTLRSTTAAHIPAVRRPSIQVLSRSTSYAVARALAEEIHAILSAVEDVTITTVTSTSSTAGSATRYVSISPNQDPADIGRDAAGRAMISSNFSIEREPTVATT